MFMTSPVASASGPPLTNASPLAIPIRSASSNPNRGRRESFSPRERLSHAECAAGGALGVILMQPDRAEDGNDRVANELLYRSAVVLDDGAHPAEVGRLHVL